MQTYLTISNYNTTSLGVIAKDGVRCVNALATPSKLLLKRKLPSLIRTSRAPVNVHQVRKAMMLEEAALRLVDGQYLLRIANFTTRIAP